MSSERRIDVSSIQVAASVMAAVTGALAASFLGVAGTIIGTAMMSVAGTMGVALYRYFLDRSREKIHSVASAKIQPLAQGRGVPAVLGHHQVTQSSRTQPDSRAHRADEAETQALPALGGTWSDGPDDTRTQNSDWSDYTRTQNSDWSDYTRTRTSASVTSVTGKRGPGRHAAGQRGNGQRNGNGQDGNGQRNGNGQDDNGQRGNGQDGNGQRDGSGDEAVNGLGRGFSWQDFSVWLRSSTRHGRARWKNLAGAVLVVFVLAIACLTLIELLVGKPLAAVVSNQPGTGTSISHVLGGTKSAPKHSPSPAPGSGSSSSPTPGNSATSSPSASVPASSSPSPVSSATDSPAQSPSPSVSASATPTPSPSPHK
jgi:hypothetical protein